MTAAPTIVVVSGRGPAVELPSRSVLCDGRDGDGGGGGGGGGDRSDSSRVCIRTRRLKTVVVTL